MGEENANKRSPTLESLIDIIPIWGDRNFNRFVEEDTTGMPDRFVQAVFTAEKYMAWAGLITVYAYQAMQYYF